MYAVFIVLSRHSSVWLDRMLSGHHIVLITRYFIECHISVVDLKQRLKRVFLFRLF